MTMLSTTAQMYTYVLDGLNKTAGTTVTPTEFEVLINGSFMDWVAMNYRMLDKDERSMDNLRALIPPPAVIPNTGTNTPGGELFVLPYVQAPALGQSHGYLFALNMAFRLELNGVAVPCSSSDGWISARALPRDLRFSVQKNPFWRPTNREPYYSFTGQNVTAITGGAVATSLRLEYLRYPIALSYSPIVDPELPPNVNQEVADMAVRKHLEELESRRLQTFAQEQQLRT